MVTAICTCLYDHEHSLVQRTILDFLLLALPIHKQQLTKTNLNKILTAILHVLLKRDMGLNRRIYAWFFGINDSSNNSNETIDSSAYFIEYIRDFLIEMLRNALNSLETTTWTLTNLIRVLLVLVDKPDVGPNIIESIFMNYLIVIYEQKEKSSEIMKTFHMLLDTLEPYFIWDYLMKNFDHILTESENRDSLTGGANLSQICGIIHMLIDISLSESSIDLLTEYLPEIFYRLMKILNDNLDKLQSNQISLCLDILKKIYENLSFNDIDENCSNQIEQDNQTIIECLLQQMIDKVDRQISNQRLSSRQILSQTYHYIEESIKLYETFFHSFIHRKLFDENQYDKFSHLDSFRKIHTNENLTDIFHRYQQSNEFDLIYKKNIQEYQSTFEQCCQLLIEFSSFLNPTTTTNIFDDWLTDLRTLSLCKIDYFPLQTIAISTLVDLFQTTNLSSFFEQIEFFQYIIAYLWEYLSDKYSREYNSKAASILIHLHSILPNNLCENMIMNQLSFDDFHLVKNQYQTIEDYKRFFKLWNLNRDITIKTFQHCLIAILIVLKRTDQDCLKAMIQEWINQCFLQGDMCRIIDSLLLVLLQSDTTRIAIHQYDRELSIDLKDQLLINSKMEIETNEISYSLPFDDEDNDEDNQVDLETESEDIDEGKQNRTNSSSSSNDKSTPLLIKPQSYPNFSEPIVSNFLSFSPPFVSRSIRNRTPTMATLSNRTTNLNNSSRSPSTTTDDLTTTNQSDDSPDGLILLYVQTYDSHRILQVLQIIEYLFDLHSPQLIHSLLITSNHNTTISQLFLKHQQIFLHSKTNHQEYQSYLYLLLNTLLIYIYSYCSTNNLVENNSKIHIHCLRLLARICHDLSYKCMDNIMIINYVVNLLKKVSFQKLLLNLFNRINQTDRVHFHDEQFNRQYSKELIRLIEEIILLENIILSNNLTLIHQPIVQQNLFLSTILQYLKRIHTIENHRYFICLIVRILPHCGSALKNISIKILEQICRNLCFFIQYENQQILFKFESSFNILDYLLNLIQQLSFICNYCLGNTNHSTHQFSQPLCPPNWMKKILLHPTDHLSDVRQVISLKLSSILSSLLFLWKTVSLNSIWTNNHRKQIREAIAELISSLTKSKTFYFIHAIIKCWNNQRKKQPKYSEEMQILIQILLNIKTYSLNEMIYNMNELIRNNLMKKQNYNSWTLQFLCAYFEEQKHVSIDCWSILFGYLKESFAQSTSSSSNTFLIIKILSFYVKQSPTFIEKRDYKDLQEITMKVLENCNNIVASSLKQPRWLRKTLQGRLPRPDLETTTDSSSELDQSPETESNASPSDGQFHSLSFLETSLSTNSSLIALNILSEHAPKLLDTIYNLTDEKDRIVLSYLQNLVTNVVPFIRIHTISAAPYYRSALSLLVNLSQYSYTKKTWKREVLELLFDSNFFQVDLCTLRSWTIIIDRMSTLDKPLSFRDLLNRINTVQIGLFTSKEQEYEQRAMFIKRLAFVIYSSEKDQFNSNLPDILSYISDLLKSPQIHAQIFLLLRVLILRISSKILSSFWPTIMSELVQILLQIEQDLLNDNDIDSTKCHLQRLTMNEISSIINFNLKIYLYACKLLDILLAMPYTDSDYFQFVRFAFAADYGLTSQIFNTDIFITFSIRLSKLFESKFPIYSPILNSTFPLLRLRTLSNLSELYPFFNSLSIYNNFNTSNEQQLCSIDKLNEIETSVLEDFVESWI